MNRPLEGNVLTVCNKDCTVEFQPAADMSWQSWAANELNQAATYPSPYANVLEGNMSTMGGSICMRESDTWKPSTMETRNSDVIKITSFMSSLPSSMTKKQKKKNKKNGSLENYCLWLRMAFDS